ncbi:hypothetical protein NIES1031_21650 [Chroogloeocystis siderophila 5.2 s.c.1]|uniref:Uncharacterized protein n=1 Tax=Chroogloeocystis siderophila 5.2 s.c.1 TaxID=247279 RepID=A0A1U7HD32_9CHRO|nr:hypothetical protein NIES1031_21650 [Chroogloeocystis siderophila 5.2 s.c.1]
MGIFLFFWIAKDSNYKYKITLPDKTTIFNSKVDIYCCAECMAGVRCNLSLEKSIQASIAILFELSDFFGDVDAERHAVGYHSRHRGDNAPSGVLPVIATGVTQRKERVSRMI